MSAAKRQLKLNAFLIGNGHHVASWRHPDARLGSALFELYKEAALLAERGCFSS